MQEILLVLAAETLGVALATLVAQLARHVLQLVATRTAAVT